MTAPIVGHVTSRLILQRALPTAALLVGPPSVGKWTLASHLAEFHRVAPVDRWLLPDGLGIDAVRLVTAFAHRAPVGPFKLIQARLEGSSKPALNALLKILEEPPPQVKFLLTSSTATMPTVSSRCVVFHLGLLTVDELGRIFTANGMTPAKAARAARFGRGQVKRGYGIDTADAPKNLVQTVAKAISVSDRELFDKAFKTWDGRTTEMLSTFLTECLTRRWSVFTEDDACGLHLDRNRLLRMVAAISRLPAARPRLGIRAALEPFTDRT